MVALSSLSGAGASLYLEIRRIELCGGQGDIHYSISGIVGDGIDEALINVRLGEPSRVEIIPICDDDGTGGNLEQRIEGSDLSRLILETLGRLYFCIESAPNRRRPGRISGYADNGRLYRLFGHQPRPHYNPGVAEPESRWMAV